MTIDTAVDTAVKAPAATLDELLEQLGDKNLAMMALTEDAVWQEIAARIKERCAAAPASVDTEADRKLIASVAHKIARIKTRLDDAGRDANAGLREKINAVDARRRQVRDYLDGLKYAVRKPLTEWEESEKARQEARDALVAKINGAAVVLMDTTSAEIMRRMDEIGRLSISANMFQGAELQQLETLRDRTVNALGTAFAQVKAREDQEAELAKLKAEQAERERQEAARQAGDQRARQAQADAARTSGEAPLLAAAAPPAPRAPDEQPDPVMATAGDFMGVADRAGIPLSPALARKLAGACAEGRIRNIRWEG